MTQDEFLKRLANRLGQAEPRIAIAPREVVGVPEFWADYWLGFPNRTEKFREELEKLGAKSEVTPDTTALNERLRQLLVDLHPTRVGVWGGDSLSGFELEGTLATYSVVSWNSGMTAQSIQTQFAEVDIGITGCDFAVADTGSVVLLASADKGRAVSLLPSIHVVLVRESQIWTRMGEVFTQIEERRKEYGEIPSSINFISGPSRSSDIENDLSIGVHGPAAVFVLILQDQSVSK